MFSTLVPNQNLDFVTVKKSVSFFFFDLLILFLRICRLSIIVTNGINIVPLIIDLTIVHEFL